MEARDQHEIRRVWERQRLLILERSPALYQDIRSAIEEGRPPVHVLNLIDTALDRTSTPATVVTAAMQAFDVLRNQVTTSERDDFVQHLEAVNQQRESPRSLKARLFRLALAHRASAILESSYVDDVRELTGSRGAV